MTGTRSVLLLLSAVLPACLDADTGSTAGEVFKTPTWIDLSSNVSVTGQWLNGLVKTGGTSAWNVGAASARTLDGPGFVRFTTAENNKAKLLGLRAKTPAGQTDGDYTRADITWGIILTDTILLDGTAKVSVWEGGQVYQTSATYRAGDVFFIEATPTGIKYRKGAITAVPFRETTTGSLPFPLQVDTTLHGAPGPDPQTDPGATLRDVAIQGFWNKPAGVQIAANNDLSKPSGTNGWNAGASGWDTIGGHGYVQFTTGETNTGKMLGLSRVSTGDTSTLRNDIDFGILLKTDATVAIWVEGAEIPQSFGTYAANEVFSIEATPTHIRYWRGVPTPTGTPLLEVGITNDDAFFPLQVDTSLYTRGTTQIPAGSTLKNIAIHAETVLHVSVEDGFLIDPDAPLRCGMGDTITIRGDKFLPVETGECGTEDFTNFADPNPLDVMDELIQFADTKGFDRFADDIIVTMDIEDPGANDIWGCVDSAGLLRFHDSIQQGQIIRGLRNRIIGTRLAFPNAKLALYPTLTPKSQATWSPAFQAQVDALEATADDSLGLFRPLFWDDDWGPTPVACPSRFCPGLDYFIPVLYTRFGCDDETPEQENECDNGWGIDGVTNYTNNAIDAYVEIQPGLPQLPYFSFWVLNCDHGTPQCPVGGTYFNRRLIRDFGIGPTEALAATLRVSLDLLADAGVEEAVLWAGNEETQILLNQDSDPNTEDELVDDYTCWL
jgi:hypothetical protein